MTCLRKTKLKIRKTVRQTSRVSNAKFPEVFLALPRESNPEENDMDTGSNQAENDVESLSTTEPSIDQESSGVNSNVDSWGLESHGGDHQDYYAYLVPDFEYIWTTKASWKSKTAMS